MRVGIEGINAYVCGASLGVDELFERRSLNQQRFDNLMIGEKSVHLPFEDPVSIAVNAAHPLIAQMRADERRGIEMVITATESGIDFGKSISTYVHHHLDLGRNCRLFEVKQACFGGTAAFMMASSYVEASRSTTTKVLVVATDVPRATQEMTYAEPTQGAGAVAFIVGGEPAVFELDFGATGTYSYEVMDTCRPTADAEVGDPDLSLYSYLDCLEQSFAAYAGKLDGVDLRETFGYLAFHTPFAGMVKGAHRKLLRKCTGLSSPEIEAHFERCMGPAIRYATRVGNLYSGSLYLALLSLLGNAPIRESARVGMFSYGSGCSSEFFSGIVDAESKRRARGAQFEQQLDARYRLSWSEYLAVLETHGRMGALTKDLEVDVADFGKVYEHAFAGRRLLVLDRVKNYHRQYRWS